MKLKSIFRWVAIAGIGALTATTLVVAPAAAEPRTLVRIAESNQRTSLNPALRNHNLVENQTVAYLTGDNFYYFNDKAEQVFKTGFGTYELVKNDPLTVRTTINPGIVWSDGTPIDAHDLLLGWVAGSGLYDDTASGTNWDVVGKATGLQKITKFPKISDDGRTVTWTFSQFDSAWNLFFGIGKPVHALTQLAYPRDSNTAAKARFLRAVKAKDWTTLKSIADKYNTAYNFIDTQPVNAQTNPKLLVSAGAYIVKSSVVGKSMTLVENPRYTSGPKPKIKTIQLVTIPDATAMAQALANREVDLIAPQATGALVESLKQQRNTKVYGYGASLFEHLDVFTNGPAFAGMSDAKKLDLRRAILLTVPRQEIVDKLVKVVNPRARVLDSITPYYTSSPNHARMAATNGVKPYQAREATRLAQAKALLEKHGYSMTNKFKINLHWGGPTNQRRADTAALMVAAAAKVPLEIVSKPDATWSQKLAGTAGQDAQFFGWILTSPSYTSLLDIYGNDGGKARPSNYIGWINPTVERNLKRHGDKTLSVEQAFKANSNFEKEYFKDAVGLPLFQHASVAAAVRTLKNVKPGPFSPSLVWNYWEWSY